MVAKEAEVIVFQLCYCIIFL